MTVRLPYRLRSSVPLAVVSSQSRLRLCLLHIRTLAPFCLKRTSCRLPPLLFHSHLQLPHIIFSTRIKQPTYASSCVIRNGVGVAVGCVERESHRGECLVLAIRNLPTHAAGKNKKIFCDTRRLFPVEPVSPRSRTNIPALAQFCLSFIERVRLPSSPTLT